MDLLAIARHYVDRMLREVPGMKALILDGETTQTLSEVYSQTEIMNAEVYLVERLDAGKTDNLPHLKAVCYLRPTRENVARLRRELKQPRFGGYYIYFTNRAEDLRLQDLAEADAHEAVHSVQEYFSDYCALGSDHFSVKVRSPHVLLEPLDWEYGVASDAITRMAEGLAAAILSLRRQFTIRHVRTSEPAARLAAAVNHLTAVEERELFDFGVRGGEGSPVLLILDRRDDPVTPLLTQWTYEAMLHEMLGITDGCVDLSDVPGVKPEFKHAVVTRSADPFFAQHASSNFGEVGLLVKGLVDEVAGEQREARDLGTIEEMSGFVDKLGMLTQQQSMAYKHVTLMGELSAQVEARGLMAVSRLEQDLACALPAAAAHYDAVLTAVGDNAYAPEDWVRLVGLWCLRYEREGGGRAASLADALRATGRVPAARLSALRALLDRCGDARRTGDLFQDRTISARFAVLAKQHIKGVENVYTQHTPAVVGVAERLARGKLPLEEYPAVNHGASSTTSEPRLILVFIVGGTTYEEAAAISALNASAAPGRSDGSKGGAAGGGSSLPRGTRVLLGGTGVHNSRSFLSALEQVASAAPAGHH